jgi:tetratricopeptide (TPR) repeat protein
LAAVIAAELAGGVALVARRRGRTVPPVADLSCVDPLLAGQLRDLTRDCRTADDWARLGDAYLAYGYFNEGEACCRLAAEGAPDRADRAYEWAFALERIGRHAEANREFERAVRLGHPRPDDCWYYVGRNWLRRENAGEARAAFAKAGDQPTARYELARLLARDGRWREAVPLLDRLSAEYPRAIQPHLLRWRSAALQDDPAAAALADRAARAPDVLPTPWDLEKARLDDTHNRLGVAAEWKAATDLVAGRRFEEAEPRLRQALLVQWDPAGIDPLAKIEAWHGRPDEAIYLLRQVIDRDGPTGHFLTRLGDMYEQTGRLDEAARAWSRAVQLTFPGARHRDYQYHKLAAYYQKKGDPAAARRHTARAAYTAGYEAFWDGKLGAARTAFEKAVELDPALAGGWFYLGEARRLTGQPDPARQAYRRCLEIDPDHGRALANLALLDLPVP